MTQRALVVSLLALALAGCLSTQDQPFPLGDGDSVAEERSQRSVRGKLIERLA